MLPLLSHGPASDALIALARTRSAAEERPCLALLALLETGDAVRHALRRELSGHALTESGFNVLACLLGRTREVPAIKDLAVRVGLTPHALETVLARLELSSLISRQPASPDRRQPAIKVTSAGRAAFSSAASHCLAAIRDALSTLPANDIDTLERACTTLRQFSTQTESHTSHLCATSPSPADNCKTPSSAP